MNVRRVIASLIAVSGVLRLTSIVVLIGVGYAKVAAQSVVYKSFASTNQYFLISGKLLKVSITIVVVVLLSLI